MEESVTKTDREVAEVKMPWFEGYDLRTETRDFDLDKQEYSFRLNPSTPGKIRAQKRLYRHLELAPDFKAEDEQCKTLGDRYTDWIEMYFLAREEALLVRLEKIRSDQSTVLNRLAETLDFDWSELIKARQDQTDLKIEYLSLQDERQYYAESYGLQDAVLDFTDILSPNEMRSRISNATYTSTDHKLAYELETISRELDLERAEQKQYLDFVQLKYQGPHDDPVNERFSVGVALQLPNSGNQRIKVREMELEGQLLRKEQSREMEADRLEFEDRRLALNELFSRYEMLSELYFREEQEFEGLSKKLSAQEGSDLLPLLKIKARALRNELKLLQLEASLFDGYLDLMERNGKTCTAVRGEVLR